MNVPSSWTRKSGSGILTGSRNVLSGRPYLTVGAHSSRRESSQSNASLSGRTELSEEDDELMQYLSQTKQKSTSKVDWATINDLGDTDALSDFDVEKPHSKDDYFLKPKMSSGKSKAHNKTESRSDKVSTASYDLEEPSREDGYFLTSKMKEDSDSKPRNEKENQTDECSTDLSLNLVVDKTLTDTLEDEMSEDTSSSSTSKVLKGNVYMLDQLGQESLEASRSMSQTSIPVSGGIITSDNEIKSTSSSHLSIAQTSKSISTVSENLESSRDFTGEEKESMENLYSSDFEDSIKAEDLLSESKSTVKDNGDHTISDSSTITINVISNLPSLNDTEQVNKSTETSLQYTTDFTSVSESQNAKTEGSSLEQSISTEPILSGKKYDWTATSDAGTQTLLGGTDYSTIPPCTLAPPKYRADYKDPTPMVLHRDTLDVLTAYSPNILALNDMMRSQLSLTRKLLDTNTAFMQSLSTSLTPDYKYTTLEDTRKYIQQHKPKVLTLKEARKKNRRKL